MRNKLHFCFDIFGLRISNEYAKMASVWKNELPKMASFFENELLKMAFFYVFYRQEGS